MKRILLPLFALLLSALPALSDDKAAQKADINKQIAAIDATYPAMNDRLGALDKKADDFKFVQAAYDKQHDQYKADIAAFNSKQQEVNRSFDLIRPARENWQQRLNAHNANVCVEHNHDGSCAGYDAEGRSIDNQRDQINAAVAPVRARQQQLNQEGTNLDQTLDKLKTIYNGLETTRADLRSGYTQLKSEFETAKAAEDKLYKELGVLEGSLGTCLRSIPAKCQKPAIDPATGKPILDQDCEKAKAACSRMFDGNR